MNKLLILLSSALLIQASFAISIGDTMNQKVAAQNNTTTSVTKLISSGTKTSTFQSVSNQSTLKYLVNNKTNVVYSISWQDKQPANLEQILGSKYYPEFQTASKKPSMHVPLRGIVIDDGNLSVSQFGSMLSGVQGVATVKDLAP